MSRRRKVILGVSAGFVFILLAALCLLPTQPIHQGKTVGEWFAVSNDVTDSMHKLAGARIVEMGPKAVPYLLQRLQVREGSWRQRYDRWWLKAPAWLRSRLPPPSLTDQERVQAVRLLGLIGPPARAATPELIRMLQEPQTSGTNIPITYYSVSSIAPGGPVFVQCTQWDAMQRLVPEALGLIGTDDPQVIHLFLERLRNIRKSGAGVPAIEAAMRSTNLIPALRRSKKELIEGLDDLVVHRSALPALVLIMAEEPDVIPAVAKHLTDRNSNYVTNERFLQNCARSDQHLDLLTPLCVRALSGYLCGPYVPVAMREIDPATHGGYPANIGAGFGDAFSANPFNADAAAALASMARKTNSVIDALMAVLRDREPRTRAGALAALGAAGPSARRAIPYIERRLQDELPEVQYQAAEALWQLDGRLELLTPFYVAGLRHKLVQARLNSLGFIEWFALRDPQAPEWVVDRLRHDDSAQVRARAAGILADWPDTVPLADQELRAEAKRFLRELGEGTPEANHE